MKLWNTYDIADNQIGLLYRCQRFEKILMPGRYREFSANGALELKIHDVTGLYFQDDNAKFLLNKYAEILTPYISHYEMTDNQVGLVFRDGHLVDLLEPGRFVAFFSGDEMENTEQVSVKVIDISESYQIDSRYLNLLGRGANTIMQTGSEKIHTLAQAVSYIEVRNEFCALLIVNGKYERLLPPGQYGFWKYNRAIEVQMIDLRLQSLEVSGQEILTRDRVSLRINLSASYCIVDAEKAALKLNGMNDFIYREMQLRLREAVGTQTLDALLENKDSLNECIENSISTRLMEYGIEVQSVGVKDIILPGDMKAILNKVVEAQKEAEANLIKRREETQAMRSLHNTAKVMENNAVLLRLKELETLEKISARINNISVYGGLDGLMNDLVKIPSATRQSGT